MRTSSGSLSGKLAEELARMPELFRPRFVADDVTPEQLATLMSQQGGRMAVLSSEGGIFQIMAGRYSSNGEANLDVFLKAYTGDSVTVDRANGRQHNIPHPTLSIGLTIQPSVLHGLIDRRNAAFRGRGLLGRFWYSLPPNLLGSRRVDPEPTRLETSTSYTTNLERLLQAEPWVDKDGAERPRIITMDASALARFHDYSRSVEAKLAPGEALSSMTDWGGKLAGSVARICGLLHLAEGYDDRTPIREDIVERAVEIGEYLEAHAKAAYFEMGSDPVIEGARIVVEWLKRREETSFTRREAHQKHRARFKKLKDLIPVLDLLIDHGYIRPQPEKSATGKGRPPSPTYDVNPDWHRSENSENSTNQKAV